MKRRHPLSKILRERGISQNALAAELGISAGHLSRILNGTRRLGVDNARKIGTRYGIPLEAFFQ